jgi:hypothetical protein
MVCVCCDPLGYCCPEGRTPDSVLFTITGVTEKPSGSPALSFDIIGSYVLARVGDSCVSWNTQIEPGGEGTQLFLSTTLTPGSPNAATPNAATILITDGLLFDALRAGSGLITPDPVACGLLSGTSFSGIAPSTRSLAQSIYLNILFTIEPA